MAAAAGPKPGPALRALAEQLLELVATGGAAAEADRAARRAAMDRVLGPPPAPTE